jgi:curved DNA-binding protein CbpA
MHKKYYKILQVDPSAEPEIITAAYKRLSIKYHPDTNPSADAHQRMQDFNEAYQVLKDPRHRADYDLYLSTSNTNSSASSKHRKWTENRPPPGENYADPSRSPRALAALGGNIVSLSFPLTYILLVFVLFRLFRSPNIIVVLAVLIFASLVAYKVSSNIERFFRLRR